MAQIVLSGDELLGILYANGLIPDQVRDIRANGQEIKLKVRTPWPVLRSVRVGVRFAGFDEGEAVFQLVTNRLIDKFDWLVDRMLESLRVADYGGRWEYPHLYLDVNRFVQQRIRGVKIDDMVFDDGLFHITTTHPCAVIEDDEPLADADGDGSGSLSL
ncbi:MAG: hypothetical protein JW993_11780 [Sedimentisphaerales bacterium]|nr:hypothetical protein [Sedimentisphaerales bacterium]